MRINLFGPLDKTIKQKRLNNLIKNIDYIFSPFTEDKTTIAIIITLVHKIIVIGGYSYILFITEVNILFILISFICFSLHYITMSYGRGCMFVRLERHYFDDPYWLGDMSLIYALLDVPINKKTTDISTITCVSIHLILTLYAINKIIRYLTKSN